jgi:hypothetical protein
MAEPARANPPSPRRSSAFDRISPPSHANPILAAMQFSNLVERQGGSTQNLRTGRILKGPKRVKNASGRHVAVPGTSDPGYVVGGEPDRRGRRIPTTYLDRKTEATPLRALQERETLRTKTDSPEASLGWWRDKGKSAPVESDASAIYHDRRTAERIGRRRGEKAIWDNTNQQEIRLDK